MTQYFTLKWHFSIRLQVPAKSLHSVDQHRSCLIECEKELRSHDVERRVLFCRKRSATFLDESGCFVQGDTFGLTIGFESLRSVIHIYIYI